MKFALSTQVSSCINEVEQKLTELLMENGFGVLTRIDVSETLKKKIGVEVPPYIILGACNPNLAHQALEMYPEIGVFLPCSICLQENPTGQVKIWALNPETVVNQIESTNLSEHGKQAKQILESVLQRLNEHFKINA